MIKWGSAERVPLRRNGKPVPGRVALKQAALGETPHQQLPAPARRGRREFRPCAPVCPGKPQRGAFTGVGSGNQPRRNCACVPW
jgi:hypothetical protein